jgi:uncharacterized protein with HEPN domain
MLEAANDAILICTGKTRGNLDAEITTRLSIVRCIEIIGEAASRVSPEGKAEFTGVPWNKIVNMRNRLVHAYHEINIDTVWNTVVEDLPNLVGELEVILGKHGGGL